MQNLDKQQVINLALRELAKKRVGLEKSAQEFRESANQASKSTESWSDSSRSQFNMMGGAIQKEILVLEKAFLFLKKIDNKNFNKVTLGSLAVLKNQDQEKYLLLVPEGAGGIVVEIDSIKVFTVSSGAGLGQVLLNKAMGEKFSFNDQGFEVIFIK